MNPGRSSPTSQLYELLGRPGVEGVREAAAAADGSVWADAMVTAGLPSSLPDAVPGCPSDDEVPALPPLSDPARADADADSVYSSDAEVATQPHVFEREPSSPEGYDPAQIGLTQQPSSPEGYDPAQIGLTQQPSFDSEDPPAPAAGSARPAAGAAPPAARQAGSARPPPLATDSFDDAAVQLQRAAPAAALSFGPPPRLMCRGLPFRPRTAPPPEDPDCVVVEAPPRPHRRAGARAVETGRRGVSSAALLSRMGEDVDRAYDWDSKPKQAGNPRPARTIFKASQAPEPPRYRPSSARLAREDEKWRQAKLQAERQQMKKRVAAQREQRLPAQQRCLLVALMARGKKRQQPSSLPSAFESEDSYARAFAPHIVEEAAVAVEAALASVSSSAEPAVVGDVALGMEEALITLRHTDRPFRFSYAGVVAVYSRKWPSPEVAKVNKVYARERQLMVHVMPDRLRKLEVGEEVTVARLGSVSSVFHQLHAINHVADMPLADALFSGVRGKGVLSRTAIIEYKSQLSRPTQELLRKRFNDAQRTAVLGAACSGGGFRLIQGPPGTGKTHTILGILSLLLMRRQGTGRQRVLVAAPSNAAIDSLLVRVSRQKLFDSNGTLFCPKVLRLGVRESVEESVSGVFIEDIINRRLAEEDARRGGKPQGREAKESARRVQREKLLVEADLVFTTLGSCRDLPAVFGSVVIDEAAQSVEPETVSALVYGCEQCVLVGDHKQLPATVLSQTAAARGFERSLFARLASGHKPFLLNVQYRMLPPISHFPSAAWYDGLLKDASSVLTRRIPDAICRAQAYTVVDVPKGGAVRHGTSWSNPGEADVVVRIILGLLQRGLSAQQVCVITPYRRQSGVVCGMLDRSGVRTGSGGVEVGTVDSFQGREKEVVLLSAVRPGGGFVGKAERLNVSLTRARSVLCVVCDVAGLSGDGEWGRLLGDAGARGVIVPRSAVASAGIPQLPAERTHTQRQAAAPAAVQSAAAPAAVKLAEAPAAVRSSAATAAVRSAPAPAAVQRRPKGPPPPPRQPSHAPSSASSSYSSGSSTTSSSTPPAQGTKRALPTRSLLPAKRPRRGDAPTAQ